MSIVIEKRFKKEIEPKMNNIVTNNITPIAESSDLFEYLLPSIPFPIKILNKKTITKHA